LRNNKKEISNNDGFCIVPIIIVIEIENCNNSKKKIKNNIIVELMLELMKITINIKEEKLLKLQKKK